jgi:type IV pilus assembly protein PilA
MNLLKKLNKNKADQGGFTLIELLVVIGILAILLAITLIAINPNKHFQDARNAKRSSDVSAILDGIYEYESANSGSLPSSLTGLTTSATEICHETTATTNCPVGSGDQINLCNDLVPTFLADLPMDPSLASGSSTSTACTTAVTYDTGYKISESSGGRLTVTAPLAEGGATVSVTR